MEVVARLRHSHISAQKARLVADMVRGKGVEEAVNILSFLPHKAAGTIKKLLHSAMSNAEHNMGADIDELLVGTIFVDEGKTMKRLSPRAKGRADRILKRSCHITIKLIEEE